MTVTNSIERRRATFIRRLAKKLVQRLNEAFLNQA